MPLINVKMVKVPASDLTKNDVFTTVLRGDGPLYAATSFKGVGVQGTPLNGSKPIEVNEFSMVRKVVGLKYSAPATA